MTSTSHKRARDSNSDTESDEQPQQLHPHPLLSFARGSHEYARLSLMVSTPLHASRVIDWNRMQLMGVEQRLSEIINPRWRMLFDVPARQFVELTYEFFSSFIFRSGDFTVNTAVEFCLGGTLHHMSIGRFATTMGLYSEEEVNQPIFTESLRSVTNRAHHLGIMQHELVAWWPTIGDGIWRPSCPASWIRDPVIRYIHRAITCTITGRHLSIEKISELDLFVLYCLLKPAPANLAALLLTSLARNRVKSARICQGPYITRLAERLGIFEHIDVETLTAGPQTVPIRIDDMIQMGIVAEGQTDRFVDVREPVVHPAAPAADQIQPITRPPQRQPRTRQPPPTAQDTPASSAPDLAAHTEIREELASLRVLLESVVQEQAAQRALLDQLLSRFPAPQ